VGVSEKRVAAFALLLPLKGFAQFAFFRGSGGSLFSRGFGGLGVFGGVMGSGC